MLKNTDKYEDTTHFSYNEYKRKTNKAPNKDLTVFISVFIVGVLIILGFAKILSPNVDVAISVDDGVNSSDESGVVSVVDDRLRSLKMEDDGKKAEQENMFSPELDEKVVLPQQHRKTVGQMEAEKADLEKNNNASETETADNAKKVVEKPQPQDTKIKPVAAPTETSIIRVVVGYYATEKQAEVAKSIIQDAGLGTVPVVKNMGGYYTLQVGSFTSREKAQQFANSLLKSNFPARVVVD